MKTILPLIITILTVFVFSGCRQDDVSPIRNVRFDPKLLNPLKAAGACTNYSFYSGKELRNLGTIHTGRVVVAFQDNLTETQLQDVIAKYGFVRGIAGQSANQSGKVYTLDLVAGLNCAQTEQAILELTKNVAVKYAGPYFMLDGRQAVGLSNEVLVKADAAGKAALHSLAAEFNAKVVGPLGADTYLVQLDKHAAGNALLFVNSLKKQEGIAHAAPDFVLAP